jgi:kynurenine formamidase
MSVSAADLALCLQAYELELFGVETMSVLDFYREAFIKFGYPRDEVDRVISSAGTDNFETLISILHEREPEVAGLSSRSSGCQTSVASLLEIISPLDHRDSCSCVVDCRATSFRTT